MKKVLITGGAGYIGTILTHDLIKRGYRPDIVDELWYGNYIPEDLNVKKTNIRSLRQEDIDPYDVVIFLGGVSNDPMAEYSPATNFVENSDIVHEINVKEIR